STAQDARQLRTELRNSLAFILEPDIFQQPGAESSKRTTVAQGLNSSVEAQEKHDRPSPIVPRDRSQDIPGRYDSIDPHAEQFPEAAAPTYKFDAKTEAYIAAEIKGMDTQFANDPALRLDLAFEWSIKKDLDPKGPPFEHLQAGGALDGHRRQF